jgi:hypothetical protein
MTQLAAWQPDPKKLLSVVGELTAKDPFDRMRPGCHDKVHEVKLKADVQYIFDLMRILPAQSNLDPYLRLEDAKGVQLAEDDDSGGNQNSAIVFKPKKTGTYKLVVTTCETGQIGKYLLEAQPLTGANRPNRALNAVPSNFFNMGRDLRKTSPSDPRRKGFHHAVWPYAMTAGTRYNISLDTSAFLTYLRLEDAAGNQLDPPVADFSPDGFQFTLLNYQPKESGIYRIIVSSYEPGATGYYGLNVRPLNTGEMLPAKNLRTIFVNGFLAKEDKTDPLRPGYIHKTHTFKATAERKYVISMMPSAIGGSYIRLEDPDGKVLKEDEDPEDVQRPLIVFQAKQTGKYKVVVSSVEKGKTGNYGLQIRPLGPTEPAPKKEYHSIQNNWNQMAVQDPEDPERTGCRHKVHVFRMKGGVKYLLDVTGQQINNQWLDACLRVEDSKGKILAQDDLSGGNDDPRIIFVPKKTDTYRLVVSTCEPGETGQYTLNARALAPGETPPPPLSSGGYSPPPPPGGREFSDIVITPLPMPTSNYGFGGNEDTHGYLLCRFAVENRSQTETHRVRLAMPRIRNQGYGCYLQAVKRTEEVAPKATVIFSLGLPDLTIPNFSGMNVEVEIDGQVQKEGVSTGQINQARGGRFNNMYGGGGRNNILHILAPPDLVGNLSSNVFKTSLGRPPSKRRSSSTMGSMYKGMHYTYQQIHQFQGLPFQGKAWSPSWLGYSSFDGVALTGKHLKEADADVKNALWQYVECGGSLLLIGEGKLPESWERTKVKGTSWTEYYPGFGQCLVFPKTRIRALTPEQWGPIADMWDRGDQPWNKIRSAGEAQRDFPVVDNLGIPVRSLFVVMLVFAVLIGPVNIKILTRKKRRIWLLWTVPVFSVLTCLLIVGFMLVSEGWHAKARIGGLVFLDETSQRASSLSWLGIYTTMNPGDGLHFSQSTEITPHIRMDRYSNQGNPRTIDWSNDQHLSSGWVAPRLPAHFMVRSSEKRLERVLLRRGKDGSLLVTNGLKAPLKSIWLADLKGKIYSAENIPEGGEAVLKLTALKTRHKLEPGKLRQLFTGDWYGLATYCAANPEHVLRPGCYVAILDGAPFFETGMSNVNLRPEPTAVFGVMKEPL